MRVPIPLGIMMQFQPIMSSRIDKILQPKLNGDFVGAEGPEVFVGFRDAEGIKVEVACVLGGEDGAETTLCFVGSVEETYARETGERGGTGRGWISSWDCDGEVLRTGQQGYLFIRDHATSLNNRVAAGRMIHLR